MLLDFVDHLLAVVLVSAADSQSDVLASKTLQASQEHLND